MAELDQSSSNHQCPRCGAELPGHVSAELCPKCLLQAGLGTQTVLGPGGTVAGPARAARSRGLPQPGEQFGHYRIVRLLGEGGMGAAFEAEDLESGRRVALKLLGHTLDSPEVRERFFREGRLAASINHPNSVYVFGTEEIGGTPVIAMELVAGGTLQHRVRAQGPLSVGEAVDGVLQIIAGLEAAQRIGILHRDIKPSNCFRDTDGAVKIGDFGLSISTTIRTEPALTVTGAVLGTPAFCSPEQLRGDELNLRSDMYSVGATLFHLLTGHTPFEAKNTIQLLATVLEQRAPSPRKFRSDIPQGLARVVLRCLEKQPGERFKDYEDLRQALAPYSSAAPTPATLGLRFLAGALDVLILGIFGMLAFLPWWGTPMTFLDLASRFSPKLLAWMLAWFGAAVLYYALPEGKWGATPGKFICRLRVVGLDKNPPRFGYALVRALLYVLLPALPYWVVCAVYGVNSKAYFSAPQMIQTLMGFSWYVMLALLFCTARRRNGFAAVHDLVTQTRVISRVALESRPTLEASEMPPPAVEAGPAIGPYHVLETLEQSADVEWLLGYDLRLLRKVWIRVVPSGTPPVPSALRNIGRVGRLRWLAGRRSPEENWDAFEAASGEPLLRLAQAPQAWSHVRYWLYDLANEISAAAQDGTLPPLLTLDRVWITGDGRAKLLDFPAPGLTSATAGSEAATQPCSHFLGEVADAALAGRAKPLAAATDGLTVRLPLHARHFLDRLPQLPDADAVTGALKPLLQRLAAVSRWRRAAIVAGCLAAPLFFGCSAIFGMTLLEQWNRANPGLWELNMLLSQRRGMNSWWAKGQPHPTDRQFATYIASHYRAVIAKDDSWTGTFALAMINGEARRFAEQSIAEQPAPTEAEVKEADAALKKHLPDPHMFDPGKQRWLPLAVAAGTLVMYVCLPALLAALLFRRGLVLLSAGVTFVRHDGAQASRLRVFWRGLVAWTPLLLGAVLAGVLKPLLGTWGAAFAAGLPVCALTVLSLALPDRGLQDRLAGTWPVPR